MTGAGVGAGIMAVPYLAERTGLVVTLLVVVTAYGLTCLIHLMLAEVIFRTGRDLQVVELMRLHLLSGRWRGLVWPVFGLLTLAFVAILTAYLAGSSEIVSAATGAPTILADAAVYAASAGVVLFGLKAVGRVERYGAALLLLVVAILTVGALTVPFDVPWEGDGTPTDAMALYALVMYALFTFYTVPQVVRGLSPDRRATVRAIVVGLAVNAGLVSVVAIVATATSRPVTQVASVGMADRIGGWVGPLGSLFVLVALVTSYWSVSLALAQVVDERTGLGRRWCWVLATLPSLVVLLAGGWRFLEWLRLAGGMTALVVVIVTVPMYVHARRSGASTSWSLGRWGSPPALALVVVAAALMAIGSVLPVST